MSHRRSRHGSHDPRAAKRDRNALKRAERELARLLEQGLPEPEVNGTDLLPDDPEETET